MMDYESELQDKIRHQLNRILGTDTWRLMNEDEHCSYMDKLRVGRYKLHYEDEQGRGCVAASFHLYPMIGCCGICVSTAATVHSSFQNKGLGTLLNWLRIDIARLNGYSLLLCTDIETNIYQRKILIRNGWSDIKKFINRRTGNTIFISVINL